MSDGPHGVRGEINWDNWGYAGWTNDSITAFPALTCLAATLSKDLAYSEEVVIEKKDVVGAWCKYVSISIKRSKF
jgi:beta-glucosidase